MNQENGNMTNNFPVLSLIISTSCDNNYFYPVEFLDDLLYSLMRETHREHGKIITFTNIKYDIYIFKNYFSKSEVLYLLLTSSVNE